MPFADVHLKPEYTTGTDNFIKDFFIPVLKEARSYDRAVGYFSSSALVALSKGLYGFVKGGGKIRVLTSPYLSIEDFESIRQGYEERDAVIERALTSALNSLEDLKDEEKDRLGLLAKLIANKILDIRIAFRKKGLYHEKIGILKDTEGRRIAFTGSANETGSALFDNYETISVFCDWTSEKNRVDLKEKHFNDLWDNRDPEIHVMRSEKVETAIIEKYSRFTSSINRDEEDLKKFQPEEKNPIPGITDSINLRSYQIDAIRKFLDANGRGIFDMATGTGKTFTALGAVCALNAKVKQLYDGRCIGTVIVVPMTYLVEQWAEDIRKFGIEPIIAYSEPRYADWNRKLITALMKHRRKEFFCLITTNDTFAGNKMQSMFSNMNASSHLLLVVDEAHNFGAVGKRTTLTDSFKYRLALSATLVRHNDLEGTDALLSYFGERCIEYGLEQAIQDKFLTPYEYHPVIVVLTEPERLAYEQISADIAKHMKTGEDGRMTIDKAGEMLLMKRARLIATAEEKVNALRREISQFSKERGILVYCGTSGHLDEVDENRSLDELTVDEDKEFSQIDAVTRMLNRMDMKTAKYTSKVSTEERLKIIEQFRDDNIQVLAAIKCLDEGVSISNIRYAFILASTTNPKEYIQRRGRVLRLWRDKEKAIIYDFITLPANVGEGRAFTKSFRSLAKKEMNRFYEFNRLAINKFDNRFLYTKIVGEYGLNPQQY